MEGILKGAAGGWSFIVSWVFPGAIFWSAFGLIVLPQLNNTQVFTDIAGMSKGNQGLALVGASLLTGIVLSTLSTTLCRILEGYYLTESWKIAWTRRQLDKRNKLKAELNSLKKKYKEYKEHTEKSGKTVQDTAIAGVGIQAGRLHERLARFPVDPKQMGPTVFANALRSLETYGYDRYKLDSQLLWSELFSVAPNELSGEVEAAWTPIHFSVSMVYMSALMVPTCLLVGSLGRGFTLALVLLAAAAFILMFAWYRLAVVNTRYLYSVVRAVVNVGRSSLALSLNLELPKKLEDERDMWDQVRWFIQSEYDSEYSQYLNNYRKDVDGEEKR